MKCKDFVVGILLVLMCQLSLADTYDLAADFSVEQNPNGVWSYGWSYRQDPEFNLLTGTSALYAWGHVVGWAFFSPGFLSPGYAVTDWDAPSEFIPAGTVSMHPRDDKNSVVRWTAPLSGTYMIDGWFVGNNYYPTTDVAILHGLTEIFLGGINSHGEPLVFSLTVTVEAGDTIDFTVGDGGNGIKSDATGISAIIQLSVDYLSCSGFEPPMANYPVSFKKNRALPLKAELFDADGFPVSGGDIAPPVVQVWFESTEEEIAVDVTDDALSAGQGDDGNHFVSTDSGKWQFNLKTSNYTSPGTYTVFMVSGDSSEYVLQPDCETVFIIK